MTTTQTERDIEASAATVYRLLTDGDSVQRWRVPDGMTSQVHHFQAREGGTFRVSLTYESSDATGKTSGRTDTYHGKFITLVPASQVVESIKFESDNPDMAGEMPLSPPVINATLPLSLPLPT